MVDLRWPRPALENPTTIQLGTGQTSTKMDPTKDYIVQMPSTPKNGSTWLDGGRNVVIIGGTVRVPLGDSMQRAIYLKGQTGIAHVEGLLIDNPAFSEFDAFAIAAPEAIVQIQNCRVEKIKGYYKTWHADLIQPWGGVKELRVDRFTGTTRYQGIQFSALKGPVGRVDLSRINLEAIGEQIHLDGKFGGNGGILFWIEEDFAAPTTLDQVYLQPREGNERLVTHPSSRSGGATLTGDRLNLNRSNITGEFIVGKPKVDFVRRGTVGLGYAG